LCGGTHVTATGNIGIVKIVSEGAIAAGIRRIEAVTASKAEEYINEKLNTVDQIASMLKSTGNIADSVEKLIGENSSYKKTIEKYQMQSVSNKLNELVGKAILINNIRIISGQIETESTDVLKNIAYQIRNSSENTVLVLGSETAAKANIMVLVSDNLVKERNINAVTIIKEIAGEINGSGGGQPFLATAGGKNPHGIAVAIKKGVEIIKQISS
jgi:alanyl-tRNA synthetase